MWNFAIPALCVLAHLYLVILFLPGYWREIEQRGYRWHDAVVQFLIPLLTISVVGPRLFTADWPAWLQATAFFTVDAQLIAFVLAGARLVYRWRTEG